MHARTHAPARTASDPRHRSTSAHAASPSPPAAAPPIGCCRTPPLHSAAVPRPPLTDAPPPSAPIEHTRQLSRLATIPNTRRSQHTTFTRAQSLSAERPTTRQNTSANCDSAGGTICLAPSCNPQPGAASRGGGAPQTGVASLLNALGRLPSAPRVAFSASSDVTSRSPTPLGGGPGPPPPTPRVLGPIVRVALPAHPLRSSCPNPSAARPSGLRAVPSRSPAVGSGGQADSVGTSVSGPSEGSRAAGGPGRGAHCASVTSAICTSELPSEPRGFLPLLPPELPPERPPSDARLSLSICTCPAPPAANACARSPIMRTVACCISCEAFVRSK